MSNSSIYKRKTPKYTCQSKVRYLWNLVVGRTLDRPRLTGDRYSHWNYIHVVKLHRINLECSLSMGGCYFQVAISTGFTVPVNTPRKGNESRFVHQRNLWFQDFLTDLCYAQGELMRSPFVWYHLSTTIKNISSINTVPNLTRMLY